MSTVDVVDSKLKAEISETLKKLKACLPKGDIEVALNNAAEAGGEFIDLRTQIQEMDLDATCDGSETSALSSRFSDEFRQKVRSLLYQTLEITKDIGGKCVKFGKQVVSFIFRLLERFPKTSMAIFVLCVLLLFCNLIPWLGVLLQAQVITLYALIFIPIVLLVECLEGLSVNSPYGKIEMPPHINLQ